MCVKGTKHLCVFCPNFFVENCGDFTDFQFLAPRCLSLIHIYTEALLAAMGEGFTPSAVLDAETGALLSQKVEETYYQILTEGTGSYIPVSYTHLDVYKRQM